MTTPSTRMLEDPYCTYAPRPSLYGLFASVSPAVGAGRAATGHQSSGPRSHEDRAVDVETSQGSSDSEDDDDDSASTVASSSYEGDESSGASDQGFQKRRGRRNKRRRRRARRKRRASSRERGTSQGGREVGSTLSLNLHMRLLLHLYGDLHNPLHNITAFTEAFPRGDRGGGLVSLRQDCVYTSPLSLSYLRSLVCLPCSLGCGSVFLASFLS